VDFTNGNWNFLTHKHSQWQSTVVTSVQTNANCPNCATGRENWICDFGCAVVWQFLKVPDVIWFVVLVYVACCGHSYGEGLRGVVTGCVPIFSFVHKTQLWKAPKHTGLCVQGIISCSTQSDAWCTVLGNFGTEVKFWSDQCQVT